MSIVARSFVPHPLLAPYVSSYLFTSINAEQTFSVDLFPVGHSVLSFAMDDLPVDFLGKDRVASDFNLTGQLTQYNQLSVSGRYSYVYVVFKPFGAYRLLHFPQSELANDYASMADILGSEVKELHTKLTDHKQDPIKLIAFLEEWLLHRWSRKVKLQKMDAVMRACSYIQAHRGNHSIRDVCEFSGMSKSTIERHFTEKVGINPKLYSRITRFTHAYQTIHKGGFTEWPEVVHRYNFFDQAHFIKDFKSFFKYAPSEVHKSLLNSAGLLRADS